MAGSGGEVRAELEALLSAMTDGALDAAGRRRLAEILRLHPDARQVYLDHCQMHALLADAHGVLKAMDAPSTRRWLRVAGTAAAAALLVVLGIALGWRNGRGGAPLGARLAPSEGSAWVLRDGRREAIGGILDVRDGDRFLTGPASRAEVRTEDGSKILLRDRTEAAFRKGDGAGCVELREGSLWCEVAPRPPGRALVFSTPRAEVTVLGTSFELTADSRETRLRPASGRVSLVSEGRAVEVKPGEIGLTDAGGVVRWAPMCDLNFAGLQSLPPGMEAYFCPADPLLTADRKVAPAPDQVRFVPAGLVLGLHPGKPNGLVDVRWKEEAGDDLILEADVAAGPRWSLGFALSGHSFEGYRVIFAAIEGYPNGVAVDTIHPRECTVLAYDSRPIPSDRDDVLRVERRGARLRAWVDGDLRIDTEVAHPLPEGRRRTFALNNFGSSPVIRGFRAWRSDPFSPQRLEGHKAPQR